MAASAQDEEPDYNLDAMFTTYTVAEVKAVQRRLRYLTVSILNINKLDV